MSPSLEPGRRLRRLGGWVYDPKSLDSRTPIAERRTKDMKRVTLTDGTGRWFDIEKAECFEEAFVWDGQNRISKATRSKWDHEELWRTGGGQWVLHSWSQWQGTTDSWTLVDDAFAARWLATNDHDPHPACAEEYAALEIR
jgi:hypothetical protein